MLTFRLLSKLNGLFWCFIYYIRRCVNFIEESNVINPFFEKIYQNKSIVNRFTLLRRLFWERSSRLPDDRPR